MDGRNPKKKRRGIRLLMGGCLGLIGFKERKVNEGAMARVYMKAIRIEVRINSSVGAIKLA